MKSAIQGERFVLSPISRLDIDLKLWLSVRHSITFKEQQRLQVGDSYYLPPIRKAPLELAARRILQGIIDIFSKPYGITMDNSESPDFEDVTELESISFFVYRF